MLSKEAQELLKDAIRQNKEEVRWQIINHLVHKHDDSPEYDELMMWLAELESQKKS